jgi:hypothetical protein
MQKIEKKNQLKRPEPKEICSFKPNPSSKRTKPKDGKKVNTTEKINTLDEIGGNSITTLSSSS